MDEEHLSLLTQFRRQYITWATLQGVQLQEESLDAAARIKTTILVSTTAGVLVGIIPVEWGRSLDTDRMLDELFPTSHYRTTFITDAYSVAKLVKALNCHKEYV